VLHSQPLLLPLPVPCSAAEEAAIEEHAQEFESHGFKLRLDSDAPPGRRVLLLSVPFSKSVQFGPSDVRELASLLLSADGGADGDASDYFLPSAALKNDAIGGDEGNDGDVVKEMKRTRVVRLPKLMSMYASRACRSAVMVGTALEHTSMKTIVSNMQGLQQPWNCPHGRPTMRHVIDLNAFTTASEGTES